MESENVYLVCREEHLALIAVECDTFSDSRTLSSGDMVVEARLRTSESHAHLVADGVGIFTHEEILRFIDNVEDADQAPKTRARKKVSSEE